MGFGNFGGISSGGGGSEKISPPIPPVICNALLEIGQDLQIQTSLSPNPPTLNINAFVTAI